MITPSYSLTATERVLPRLALDFTTASLDPRITFTRSGNTATVINSSGVIVGINADLPRFDFNPSTLVCRGLLIEESRTNALLNSLIDGTSLATQSVTVTAAARTLSFYGTGEIVLSGAHSATVTGTGAYPTRTTLTFTPTVGALTLTVTGTVQFAQLELGSFATSFIPTAGVAVARNADVATMTGTNFSDWYNASQGAFVAGVNLNVLVTPAVKPVFAAYDGTFNSNRVYLNVGISGQTNLLVNSGGSSQASILGPFLTASNLMKVSSKYKVNDFALAANGITPATDTSGAVPVGSNRLDIGFYQPASAYINGHVAFLNYYPLALTNNEVQAFSK
jgi:hypothetical protein